MTVTRIAMLLPVLLGTGQIACAEPDRSGRNTIVGSWSCSTMRDHVTMQLTFAANGEVAGTTDGKVLQGRYVLKQDNLSIVAGTEFISASSLRIAHRAATADLLNGDKVSCRQTR